MNETIKHLQFSVARRYKRYMRNVWLIRNKAKVFRGSMTLRMLELGFAITILELVSVLLPEFGHMLPFDRAWLLIGASVAQFLAWVCRFILQPKISGDSDGE